MYLEEYTEGAVIIREGTPGSTLYVMEGKKNRLVRENGIKYSLLHILIFYGNGEKGG